MTKTIISCGVHGAALCDAFSAILNTTTATARLNLPRGWRQ
jgi:hypothetical protein